MHKTLLEVCCGSLPDAVAAERGGADRVELCSALFLGGLTPSWATIQEVKARLRIPFVVLLRPRSGGFCYSQEEMRVLERDAELAIASGAEGIVVGILQPDGRLDTERCKRIRKIAGAKEIVFHRAFDVVPDPMRTLDEVIDLGFTRVLTSGQSKSALEGVELIKRLIDHARNRIEILPGSGIRPENVRELIELSGCDQVHMTASRICQDASTQGRPEITFGAPGAPSENFYQCTDEIVVRETARILKSLE